MEGGEEGLTKGVKTEFLKTDNIIKINYLDFKIIYFKRLCMLILKIWLSFEKDFFFKEVMGPERN